jgi:hypothetical protein
MLGITFVYFKALVQHLGKLLSFEQNFNYVLSFKAWSRSSTKAKGK